VNDKYLGRNVLIGLSCSSQISYGAPVSSCWLDVLLLRWSFDDGAGVPAKDTPMLKLTLVMLGIQRIF